MRNLMREEMIEQKSDAHDSISSFHELLQERQSDHRLDPAPVSRHPPRGGGANANRKSRCSKFAAIIGLIGNDPRWNADVRACPSEDPIDEGRFAEGAFNDIGVDRVRIGAIDQIGKTRHALRAKRPV